MNAVTRVPVAARPGLGLTDLDPASLQFAHTLRGRRELWAARSADGVWDYRRVEDTGTTWDVTYLGADALTVATLSYEPSLDAARRGTCCGWTLAELRRASQHAQAVQS